MNKPLSQNAIGRALGMSSANMVKLKKQGCPMDSVESVRDWREKKQNVAARKAPPEASFSPVGIGGTMGAPTAADTNDGSMLSDESHDQARTRREIAEANLAEMKESEQRGFTIRVDAVKSALALAFSSVREALLQLPARLAPLLAAETDTAAAQTLLHTEIHRALTQLAGAADRIGTANK